MKLPPDRQPAAGAIIRVVVADDHDVVRSGMKTLLLRIPDLQVVGEARDGQQLVELVDRLLPDIALTDIGMPVMDGLTAISQIHARHPQVRLLVLSMQDTVDVVRHATAQGACGYLMKDAPGFEIEHAVRTVMATGSYYSPAIAQRLLQAAEPALEDELTPRQIEILTLLASGLASKQIAHALGLSPKTVDMHRARIMERLRLGDVASLTRYAVRRGLVRL
jgi:DNA-binding NarL/FixJ family response regulator